MSSTSKAETPNRLIHEGLTLSQLKEKGVSVGEIRQHARLGNDFIKLPDFKEVGYSAQEMKAGGFSWTDIKIAGYSGSDLVEFVKTPQEIQGLAVFKDQGGFKAEDLRSFNIKDLKVAGYTAQDFKAGGYTAKDLKKGTFTSREILPAGYTVNELHDGGYTVNELKAVGFTYEQLITAFPKHMLEAAGMYA